MLSSHFFSIHIVLAMGRPPGTGMVRKTLWELDYNNSVLYNNWHKKQLSKLARAKRNIS